MTIGSTNGLVQMGVCRSHASWAVPETFTSQQAVDAEPQGIFLVRRPCSGVLHMRAI